MRAADVMTSPVITLSPDTSVKVAAQVLLEHQIAAVPVLLDGVLVGMVSEIDVLSGDVPSDPRAHLLPVARPTGAARTVGDVMTRDAIALSPETDVADVVVHMRSAGVRSVPIIEHDRVVGIVSRRDLLGSLARADEQILYELRTRLRTDLPDGDAWGLAVEEGTAVLWPMAGTSPDPDLAVRAAATVPGVQHVRVQPSPDAP